MRSRYWLLGISLAAALAACGDDAPRNTGGSGGDPGAGGTAGDPDTGGTGGSAGDPGPGGTGGGEPAEGEVWISRDGFCLDCFSIQVKEVAEYYASVRDGDGNEIPDQEVSWSSSDPSIFTVDGGVVTALRPGEAELVATAGQRKGVRSLRVRRLPVVSIEIVPSRLSLAAGEEASVSAIPRNEDGEVVEDVELLWIVGNPAVADAEPGLVRGVGEGSTPLFVASVEDNLEGTARIDVSAAQPRPAGAPFGAISVGTNFSCGLDPASRGLCWGWNYWGQLGRGAWSDESFPTPAAVRTDLADEPNLVFDVIRAQEGHACALTPGGQAWCWGSNGSGELGVVEDLTGFGGVAVPMPVLQQGPFSRIELGYDFTCALDSDSKAWCWGMSGDGALGLGGGLPDKVPVPRKVLGDRTFLDLGAGLQTTCAIDTANRALCWGNNATGSLGLGSDTWEALVPTEVHGDHAFLSIAHGSNHVCALTGAGEAWCWGDNSSGQTGREPTFSSWTEYEPVPVPGDHAFVAIAGGAHHSCALDDVGRAWCWGNNLYGQLGDGTLADSPFPVEVAGGHRFQAIAAGGSTTCGIRSDGAAYCWGSGHLGMSGAGFDLNLAWEPWPVAEEEGR
ncbi:hypothetical protein [Vulgatibacter incomptus]|uniref:BNR repeat domain protein n=1 Tax=Vulgatibacter incomptus TaxID=1391653 RepID=A0A0K1PBJ7_9BACT|nr:hypothetical protein [Vulgatibacter incomptus]AKU90913.1 BNR repeat domain protein [Vulgatibacter incomptus]